MKSTLNPKASNASKKSKSNATKTLPTASALRQVGISNSGLNLGGIGTGGVELWPDGRFYHWNLVNSRPWANYQKIGRKTGAMHTIDPIQPAVGDADFFVRIKAKGQRPLYRWLFTGHGQMVSTASHFFRHHKYFFIKSVEAIDYTAAYPFIQLDYVDPAFPLKMRLTAWTPFIARDVKNSSLPVACFDFSFENTGKDPLEVSLIWQQQNLAGYAADKKEQAHEKRVLEAGKAKGNKAAQAVFMEGSLAEPKHDSTGNLTIWAEPERKQEVTSIAANPYMQNLIWSIHRSGDLMGDLLPERLQREELNREPNPDAPNKSWLCIKENVQPGAVTVMKLGLSWYFPNHYSIKGTLVGHMYENWFKDSADVATYVIANRESLRQASRQLPDNLLASSLPEYLKLAMLDQLSTLTKSTHFIKNGRFGLQEGHGCCAFNTIDVDHYSSYALSTLFPELRMTILDMHRQMAHPSNGKIYHGFQGTVETVEPGGEGGYNRWDCCCQYMIQLYRDCKWSGNRETLERCWPVAKKAMELIISMDFYEVGLPYIEGGITYDHWRMKGVVAYMAGVYLAALRAMEDAADVLGDTEARDQAQARFEAGVASFENLLWNGQANNGKGQYSLYYSREPKMDCCSGDGGSDAAETGCCSSQSKAAAGAVDKKERAPEGHVEAQRPDSCCVREGAYVEILDTGVMTDLLNGHATSAVLGLGGFNKSSRVKKQLRLILDRNTQTENFCVINGSYPDEHFLDEFPFMQWQTPWTGTEYFLALQLYCAGMIKEGDKVIDLVHERHVREGMRFDHAECNNHYARPLCIWGAYNARLGLDFDAWRKCLTLDPPDKVDTYEGLLQTATGGGWLSWKRSKQKTQFSLEWQTGKLPLKLLKLGVSSALFKAAAQGEKQITQKVTLDGKKQDTALDTTETHGRLALTLARQLDLKSGKKLEVRLQLPS